MLLIAFPRAASTSTASSSPTSTASASSARPRRASLKARREPSSQRLHPEQRVRAAAGRRPVERRGEHRGAIHWALDDIELVGGSAGDGICFERTVMIHNGRVRRARSDPDDDRDRVSLPRVQDAELRADPDQARRHRRRHGEPHRPRAQRRAAAREYASAIGLLPDDLGPFSFASYPLVVKVGGDYMPLDPQHEP